MNMIAVSKLIDSLSEKYCLLQTELDRLEGLYNVLEDLKSEYFDDVDRVSVTVEFKDVFKQSVFKQRFDADKSRLLRMVAADVHHTEHYLKNEVDRIKAGVI